MSEQPQWGKALLGPAFLAFLADPRIWQHQGARKELEDEGGACYTCTQLPASTGCAAPPLVTCMTGLCPLSVPAT